MVNIIGVPVMLIGTPKSTRDFEADLRSARRGAGFGAIFWGSYTTNATWKAQSRVDRFFTDNLWQLQLLQRKRCAVIG